MNPAPPQTSSFMPRLLPPSRCEVGGAAPSRQSGSAIGVVALGAQHAERRAAAPGGAKLVAASSRARAVDPGLRRTASVAQARATSTSRRRRRGTMPPSAPRPRSVEQRRREVAGAGRAADLVGDDRDLARARAGQAEHRRDEVRARRVRTATRCARSRDRGTASSTACSPAQLRCGRRRRAGRSGRTRRTARRRRAVAVEDVVGRDVDEPRAAARSRPRRGCRRGGVDRVSAASSSVSAPSTSVQAAQLMTASAVSAPIAADRAGAVGDVELGPRQRGHVVAGARARRRPRRGRASRRLR